MRLTLVVILIVIICNVVAGAHWRKQGWGLKSLGTGGRKWQMRGNWGPWSNYNECSVTCGVGIQQRHRICKNRRYGGCCWGKKRQKRYCRRSPCPVNSDWGEWSNFTECSVTCGGGNKSRNRSCDNPEPAHDGLDCDGNNTETMSCNTHHCPVNGDWGEWSNFTECSVTCGGGNNTRNRSCDNPEPAHDGLDCHGNNTETMSCNTHHCPVNGDWGEWSNFTECSVTCGGGNKTRNRSCDNPEPAHDGLDCDGNNTETMSCNTHHCPVNGDWGEWSNFTECSVTCGGGNKTRNRSCDNPEPAHDGLDCDGNNTETMSCNTHHCPVNGDWGEWSNFTECSVTCGGGNKTRNRSCDNPEPAHDGLDCDGNNTETMSCNTHHCPVNLCEIKSCPGDTPCVPIIVRSGYNCSCVERLSMNQLTSESKCDARRIITHIQEYPNSQNLKTTIPGVPGKKMVISFFDDFGIEQTTFCRFDYIQIDGIKYCGSKAPEDITLPTGLGTEVRFVSGFINQYVGYTFTYQYIDDMPDNNICKNGGTRTPSETCTCLDGFSGPTCQNTPIMTSPGINIEQKTTFNLLGSPGKELVLTFNDYFRSPNGKKANNRKGLDCGEDYVEIGGNRYCSGVTPAPITIPTGSGTSVVYKCSGEKMYKSRLSYVYTET